jgi:hypothetical protein
VTSRAGHAKIAQDRADDVVFGTGSLLFSLRADIGPAAWAQRLPNRPLLQRRSIRSADVVWAGLSRLFPVRRSLRRQDTEKGKARRPAGRATKFNLLLNLKTAKALGPTMPQTLVLSADE